MELVKKRKDVNEMHGGSWAYYEHEVKEHVLDYEKLHYYVLRFDLVYFTDDQKKEYKDLCEKYNIRHNTRINISDLIKIVFGEFK